MGIGLGILLIVIGAIFLFALNVDIPFFTDNTLGIILIVAGVLALVIALVMQAQRGRTKHVQENRYDGRRRPLVSGEQRRQDQQHGQRPGEVGQDRPQDAAARPALQTDHRAQHRGGEDQHRVAGATVARA